MSREVGLGVLIYSDPSLGIRSLHTLMHTYNTRESTACYIACSKLICTQQHVLTPALRATVGTLYSEYVCQQSIVIPFSLVFSLVYFVPRLLVVSYNSPGQLCKLPVIYLGNSSNIFVGIVIRGVSCT
jgi:hypothetical protein